MLLFNYENIILFFYLPLPRELTVYKGHQIIPRGQKIHLSVGKQTFFSILPITE